MVLDNSEEYNDPILYDKENESYLAELPFLLEWASKMGGPIIDVACGTGRITIPLAKEGYKLIGVDIHKGMLEEAKSKSSNNLLQVEWIEQDCTNMNINTISKLIYSVGNSFQHFLTNEAQDRFISSVYKHLDDEGVFIFGTRFPSAEELLQPPTEEYWRSYIDNDTQITVDVFTLSNYDSLNQIQHYTTIRKYRNLNGDLIKETKTNIRLRYVFPKEMERILFNNGFKILHLYSDWNKTPLTNDSYEMIYVCKKTKSKTR
ncbi:class I SAM-dependent methyltransferase [Ureibacillus manganicus]|uniref:Methyltransferase n=1 Tax=Ureibacillus manganicus DSM 26584 TaxID=1384049 RepID=A0A0A3IVL1_9BACL|nr:class I SAM-dependent methyltransferase [Ureibacillus manganicus]KGR78852.1 methyltransferase [Ureibacillus manganicus DSM 26584]